MKSWRARGLLLGGVVLLAAIPALSQEAPESLLPPGFGDTQNLPPPEEKATPSAPSRPQAPSAPGVAPPSEPGEEGEAEDETSLIDQPQPTNYFSIPEGRARPVDIVGPLQPGNFGLGQGAFGPDNGRQLAGVMRRLDAPLPSRWTSILLRRALLSHVTAPAGVHPVDWVAERADLLLRMGEADAARMLVQAVDQENYTPRMIQVAGQTALATADPAALCPLVGPARARSSNLVWTLADAMCAALESEPARASALIDEATRRQGARGIDLQLAERVIGAGGGARRAAAIDWEGVGQLTTWRFGLAGATGIDIPAPLLAGAGPRIQAWFARAPMIPVEQRVAAASTAATLGVFSSRSLAEVHGLVLDRADVAETAGTVGARLRTAWIGASIGERMTAMRGLWTEPGDDARERYARLILTAEAAARIPASSDYASDAPNLIAAMLSAGLDREAARWATVAQEGGDDRAWAMLALGTPQPSVDLSTGRVETFIDNDDSIGKVRSQMLVAALVGLGRISDQEGRSLAASAGLTVSEDPWTAAIDRAARERRPGTVALLAGLGMQTSNWSGVPPRYLFRITRALRAVGLDYEARMIAAEAVARL